MYGRKEKRKVLLLAFADRVKHLRDKKGWSQDQLAKKLGKSRSAVAGYESETKNRIPRGEDLIKLAQVLDTTTGYLLGESGGISDKLDLKEIKKALIEKELTYDGQDLTKEEQEGIRSILLAVIEREEKKASN